jgi:hypothetical protein
MGKDDVATLEQVASDVVQNYSKRWAKILPGANSSQPAS